MRSRSTLPALVLAFMLPCIAGAAAAPSNEAAVPTKAIEAKAAMRDLWVTHIFWVRNVVDARLAADDGRAKIAEQQVVANARAIAGAIEPYYGKAASDQLFKLLAGHWKAISGYLDATRADDKAARDAASKQLMANADSIAKFLSGANPNLPADTVRGLLEAHGAHHIQQIRELKDKQYQQEAITWNAMKDHMYVIADVLAGAIAKQFPDKFS